IGHVLVGETARGQLRAWRRRNARTHSRRINPGRHHAISHVLDRGLARVTSTAKCLRAVACGIAQAPDGANNAWHDNAGDCRGCNTSNNEPLRSIGRAATNATFALRISGGRSESRASFRRRAQALQPSQSRAGGPRHTRCGKAANYFWRNRVLLPGDTLAGTDIFRSFVISVTRAVPDRWVAGLLGARASDEFPERLTGADHFVLNADRIGKLIG